MRKKKQNLIADVLFSGVQQRLFALLFVNPDRSYYTNELARLAKTGRGSLQRELERLIASGLVEVHKSGHQKHYKANKNSVIFHELRSVSIKLLGYVKVIRDALARYNSSIKFAFIFGSIAKGTDTASSDIDVMVIADGLGYSELFEVLTKAENLLGRKVSPTVYSTNDFLLKKRENNHFVSRVLDQPKIVILGAEHAIDSGTPA